MMLGIIVITGCVPKEKLNTALTEAEECVGEGESFVDAVCCQGLEERATYISYNYPKCMLNKEPSYVCVKCDDGTCGLGENGCNCPEDCK